MQSRHLSIYSHLESLQTHCSVILLYVEWSVVSYSLSECYWSSYGFNLSLSASLSTPHIILIHFLQHILSVYSKRNAHLIPNFLRPPWGRGAKKCPWSISIIIHVNFWPPGGPPKNSELNVCFFWNRLCIHNLQSFSSRDLI